MAFIPVPNTAMVELFFTQDAQNMENTLYFQKGDPWTTLQLATLATEIITWWTANLASNTVMGVALRAVKATSLESDTAPAFELPATPGTGGTFSGVALPNNVTMAVKFLTDGRGRSARGRNYIVGIPDSEVTGNTISAAYRNSIVSAYNELRDSTVITSGEHVVVSRFTGGNPRTTGLAQEVTGVAITDAIVDSQRRRLPGRGT